MARIKRGMGHSPLMKLIVNEHEIPKRAKEDRERRMQYNVRRTFIGGGILDVIGEGHYARVWIGRHEKAICLATLDQEQMRAVIGKFQEALSGMGDKLKE